MNACKIEPEIKPADQPLQDNQVGFVYFPCFLSNSHSITILRLEIIPELFQSFNILKICEGCRD